REMSLLNHSLTFVPTAKINDFTITIKQADKGGAIVIMDTEDYEAECKRQLLDDIFYTLLEDAVSSNVIDQLISAFLYVQHPRVPLFYTLPEIHKSLETPVGRPIVSGIGSVTENNSEYGDYYLKPLSLPFTIPPGQGGDIFVKRKSREIFWIFTLDTLFPRGLNQ
uniref:Uncharacterized protein n=1 Tax=Sinocyclocheilus anshuiensis TaxID=1608454 RepID=A0A671PBT2_9TELE